MLIRTIIALLVLALSSFLFKKAAGSLKLTELNMISTIYYYLLMFSLLGGSLIFIGFRDHYLIQRVAHEQTF